MDLLYYMSNIQSKFDHELNILDTNKKKVKYHEYHQKYSKRNV